MAYVERHRGGQGAGHRGRVADLARTDLATLRSDIARRTDLEYML
jgi:hypothetical protein